MHCSMQDFKVLLFSLEFAKLLSSTNTGCLNIATYEGEKNISDYKLLSSVQESKFLSQMVLQWQVPMTGLQFLKPNFIAKQLSWVPKKCSKGPSFPLFLPSFLPFLSFQRLKTKPVCHTCDSETKQKRSKSI